LFWLLADKTKKLLLLLKPLLLKPLLLKPLLLKPLLLKPLLLKPLLLIRQQHLQIRSNRRDCQRQKSRPMAGFSFFETAPSLPGLSSQILAAGKPA
jgi:hypothetical protein